MYSISKASIGFLRYRFGNCQSSIVGNLIACNRRGKDAHDPLNRLVVKDIFQFLSVLCVFFRLSIHTVAVINIPQMVMMTYQMHHHYVTIHYGQRPLLLPVDVGILSKEFAWLPFVEAPKPKPFFFAR